MRRKIIPYNPKLKKFAKQLRENSTLAEVLLWQRLKCKRMLGYDFHRQKPIYNFIVDFFCPDLMMAVEIDGVSHEDRGDYDIVRHRKLEECGMKILRFKDE